MLQALQFCPHLRQFGFGLLPRCRFTRGAFSASGDDLHLRVVPPQPGGVLAFVLSLPEPDPKPDKRVTTRLAYARLLKTRSGAPMVSTGGLVGVCSCSITASSASEPALFQLPVIRRICCVWPSRHKTASEVLVGTPRLANDSTRTASSVRECATRRR